MELSPLPYPALDSLPNFTAPGYTAEQMQEAVLKERERCAKICEHNADIQCNPIRALAAPDSARNAAANWMRNVAAAIRQSSGTPES